MSRPSPFSSRARVSLAIARALAAGRGERDLAPLHVALGLLREGENAALAVLHHHGLDLSALRTEVERALGAPPGGSQPDEVALPATPGEERLVVLAREASARVGDEHVGPEHLLLAIVGLSGDAASAILTRHGVTPDSAVAAMGVVIHRH